MTHVPSRWLAAALFVALLVAFGSAVAGAKESQTVTGTISKVDAATKTLTVKPDTGADQTFHVKDADKVPFDGKSVKLTDIKAGTKVTVTYEKKGTDNEVTSIKSAGK